MRGPIERQKLRFFKAMKMDCIEYAAPYLPQAAAERRLEDYFAAVKNLYNDRCPYDPEVDWELFRLSLTMVSMARGASTKDHNVHWEIALSLEYDRLHRPSPFAISFKLDIGRTRWLEDFVDEDDKRLEKERQEALNAEEGQADDPEDDEGGSQVVLDFLTPGIPDMGEDAHLFKIRRSQSPDIIAVG